MAFESTPARNEIRDLLVQALLAVPVEGTILHGDIAREIGLHTSSPDAIKHAALMVAAKVHGAVFENVRGVGYRRIAASDIHRVGQSARRTIRRKARRCSAKMVSALAANSNSMTNQDRLKVHSEIALLGIIQVSASRLSAKRAEFATAMAAPQSTAPNPAEIARSVAAALHSAEGI